MIIGSQGGLLRGCRPTLAPAQTLAQSRYFILVYSRHLKAGRIDLTRCTVCTYVRKITPGIALAPIGDETKSEPSRERMEEEDMISARKAVVFGMFLIVGLIWAGCSDESGELTGSSTSGSGVTQWFPLDAGYSASYEVTYSNGNSETVRYEIGTATSFRNETAIPWRATSSDGSYTTAHLKTDRNSLYYYPNEYSEGEKILKTPLSTGSSWSINEGTDTVNTGGIPGNDIFPADLFSPRPASFPVTGSVTMTVAGYENADLSTGQLFSNTVKVVSTNTSTGRSNYYWYGAGVGLVKWAKGVPGDTLSRASEVGEITRYGF